MFWDSSALVPLLFPESRSAQLTSLMASDREPAIWWASPVECQSAVYRRHRLDPIPPKLLNQALRRLSALARELDTIAATEAVRKRAGRMLAVHPVRAADALQLAAALVWCEDDPAGEKLVCLDTRLGQAALREGFLILPDGTEL